MEKTKRIINILIKRDENWDELQVFISNIEKYANTDPGSAIGGCKSLIEAIFKTITKKKNSDNRNISLADRFNQVSKVLQLEESYKNVIRPFCISINEIRNKHDRNAHAQDIKTLSEAKQVMSDAETHFWIALTDDIASYILDYYEKLMTYKKNEELNDWLEPNGWKLFKNEPDKYSLFAELKNSPNFEETTQIIEKFGKGKYQFSDIEIKVLRKIYVSNSQVYRPVQDYPNMYGNRRIKEFFEEAILERRDLFTEDELNEFLKLLKPITSVARSRVVYK